jgi:4-amino-4-deoxy-L-arabinose transferase-like glycosyltransferase
MRKSKNYPLFFIGLAIIGIISLLFVTRWGIGLNPDSTRYISAARNLRDGFGLTEFFGSDIRRPMTHFPPLYPLLLTGFGVFGIDPLDGARWLNVFLFGANILLIGLAIRRYTSGSIWIPLFGSSLILTSLTMLHIHAMAMTEPLFILLGFSGLLLLAAYLEKSRPSLLIISASATGLAFLTRYPGVALVATGGVGILLFSRKRFFQKIVDASIFGVISLFPIMI